MPSIHSDDSRLSTSRPLQDLLYSASKYMRLGLAKSTIKAYDSAWYFFSSFCASLLLSPLPVDVSVVCAFIVFSFESRNLQTQSIKAMLAGIQFHIRCQDPASQSLLGNPSIQLLLNGLKKARPPGNDKRLPLTISLVHKLVSRLRQGCFSPYIDTMLEAVLLMAFYGFLRCGEYTTRTLSFNSQHDLTFSDLSLEEHMYSIFLKHSKSDRSCQGTQIIIAKTNTTFCPFSSMMRYLQHRSPTLRSAPLFIIDGVKPMSRSWFALKLRDLCLSCGLPPERYSPHSLRIGAATTAALHLPTSTLKSLGRWSSSAYQRYVRLHKKEILSAQKLMSSCTP